MQKMNGFGEDEKVLGTIGITKGLELFKNSYEIINKVIVKRPKLGIVEFPGSAIVETVKVPIVVPTELYNPDHWTVKEALFPMESEDGDTSVAVLLDTITECVVDEGSITFKYNENGEGYIRFELGANVAKDSNVSTEEEDPSALMVESLKDIVSAMEKNGNTIKDVVKLLNVLSARKGAELRVLNFVAGNGFTDAIKMLGQ